MPAFEKNRGLGIWDWYFRGRMERISMKKKGNKKKECPLFLVFVHLPIYSVYTSFLTNILTFLSMHAVFCKAA